MSSLVNHLRHELGDNGITDDQLVTALIDVPVLRGGERLMVAEARRIIFELSEFVERHDKHTHQTHEA